MAIAVDYFSMEKRALEQLEKAKRRRDIADFDVKVAEEKVEQIKAARLKEGR